MDGGTVWNVNIPSAINQCLDMGYAEEDIIMDVIICGYTTKSGDDVSNNALENWLGANQEKDFYENSNSIEQALAAFPNVQSRYYFQMHHLGCTVDNSLDFNNSTTWCLQLAGRRDAQDMLNLGQDQVKEGLK